MIVSKRLQHPQQKPRVGSRVNPEHAQASGLVAAYLFNEGGGVTVNNATGQPALTATAGTPWTTGKQGAAINLNGSSQSLTAPYYAALGQTRFTIEARVKLNTLSANQMIFNVIAPAGESLYLWWNNNTGFVTANSWVAGFADGGGTFHDNVWTPGGTMDTLEHTLTYTYDGANVKLYFDGLLVLTSAQTATPRSGTGTGTLYVGQRSTSLAGGFWFVNGTIGHVRMWDHAKTAAEVAELVASPFGLYDSFGNVGRFMAAPRVVLPPMALPGTTPSGTTTKKRFYQKFAPGGAPPTPTNPLPGRTLTGHSVKRRYYYKPAPLTPSTNPQACWEPLTQKLLGSLGKPFLKTTSGLLWSLMSTYAREMTRCVSTVVVKSGEARGGGTFTVPTTFDPIQTVAGVRRVDGNGNTLESYTVISWDGRSVTVAGTKPPKAGDYLQVDYSYQHDGLLGRVRSALLELNILTSTGSFLDAWGSWFGMTRVKTGKYGQAPYGFGQKYGTGGVEPDNTFANRIIDRVTQGRNTPAAIAAAVKRLTGGTPYVVSWLDGGGNRSFIFRPSGTLPWAGESDTRKHLIWGRTARFVNGSTNNGGAFVFEVWVPSGSGYSTATLLSVVNQYKPAGSKAYIRYYS